MDSISPCSSPLHRSRATSLLINPSKTVISQFDPKFSIFFFFFFFFFTFSSSASDPTYARLCNHLVPASPIRSDAGPISGVSDSLRLVSGYFSGAGGLIVNRSAAPDYSRRLSFRATSVRRTDDDDVFELRGQLRLQQRGPNLVRADPGRLLKMVYPGHRVSNWRVSQWMHASLRGFWSRSSGKLCMIGTGSYGNDMRDASVVLKLNYPLDLNILNSLINGTIESFDDKSSLNYFEPFSILAVSLSSNYRFTLVENGNANENGGCVGVSDGESLSLNELSQGACNVFSGRMDPFEIQYGTHCGGDVSCNPLGGDVGKLPPKFMYYYGIRCSARRKVQMLLGFPDSNYRGFAFPFYPNTTLVSEGLWDEKENRLCAVACRILNFTEGWGNPHVGDCSIKLTLIFPAVLSLRNRSTALGRIWSEKGASESGYFSEIRFQGSMMLSRGLHGWRYMYTEIDRVRKSCGERIAGIRKGEAYPDGYSSDMRFSMLVRNSKGQVASGYSSPLFVGDQIYDRQFNGVPIMGELKPQRSPSDKEKYSNLLNVSYTMIFNPPSDFKLVGQITSAEVEIAAEGMYNRNTGRLCMTGCWHLRSSNKTRIQDESLACEIMINVEFPPLNPKRGESFKGTIESTRQKSDPYYFDPLQLSSISIYTSQADASIWRMDFEVIMLLVSNTLACVFIGLQLLHVNKHPEVLPYISVVMLLVITLGHMIPLILNFEALFVVSHGHQNGFLGSGSWLDVNELVVRMVIMIAFLLELRLLQLTWSSRLGEGSQPGLWVSEKKVLCMILPLYIGGGLTAWFVHIWKNSHQKSYRPFRLSRHRFRSPRGHSFQPPSFWEDFKSYAGLLLDGFLLPQILFNVLVNSEGKALESCFYVGTTIVRILPHAYDLYRAHNPVGYLDLSYIYANHRMDYYSTAWDTIIPCSGILFAVLVYLQQRFGSRCILPKRFRGNTAYEKVPAIGNDDL